MSAPDKVRAVLRELGIETYDLKYEVTGSNKPHSFIVRSRDVTVRGSTTRAIIRAIRRTFVKSPAA